MSVWFSVWLSEENSGRFQYNAYVGLIEMLDHLGLSRGGFNITLMSVWLTGKLAGAGIKRFQYNAYVGLMCDIQKYDFLYSVFQYNAYVGLM